MASVEPALRHKRLPSNAAEEAPQAKRVCVDDDDAAAEAQVTRSGRRRGVDEDVVAALAAHVREAGVCRIVAFLAFGWHFPVPSSFHDVSWLWERPDPVATVLATTVEPTGPRQVLSAGDFPRSIVHCYFAREGCAGPLSGRSMGPSYWLVCRLSTGCFAFSESRWEEYCGFGGGIEKKESWLTLAETLDDLVSLALPDPAQSAFHLAREGALPLGDEQRPREDGEARETEAFW